MRSALRAIRYARPLGRSPLVALRSVGRALRQEGLAETRASREWMLARILDGLIGDALCGGARSAADRLGDGALAGEAPAGAVAACEADREVWRALRERYLATERRPAAEIADGLGITYRTFARRLERGHRLLADLLRQREVAILTGPDALPGLPPARRVIGDEAGEAKSVRQALVELLAAIRDDARVARLSASEMAAVARHPPRDLVEYRLGRIAEWSQARYRIDDRFVEMTLLLDRGEMVESGRWLEQDERYRDLRDALASTGDPALVLLGAPGSGKSTLLRRLELDAAVDALRGGNDIVTLLVSLGACGRRAGERLAADPADWLAGQWSSACPDLPALDAFLREGRMLLLLDGLNEMPHTGQSDYRQRILAWKQLIGTVAANWPGNRILFACRSLDYSAPLSGPALRVPQLRIEPMSDAEVRDFLAKHVPGRTEVVWEWLERSGTLAAVRIPFLLRLLVEQLGVPADLPVGRAALFTGLVRQSLQREVERDHPLFQPDGLLTDHDYQRVVRARRWRSPYELPERGCLFRGLADLAYAMQSARIRGESSQVRMGYDEVLSAVAHCGGEPVLLAGEALGLVEEDADADEVMFRHQLVQEYFAGRRMAARRDCTPVAADWRVATTTPGVEDVVAQLAQSDPLPPLPATGWEETAAMAAAMASDPDRFLAGLAEANLALAGRCAAMSEVARRLGAECARQLGQRLLERSRDEGADLRDRIACGLALGELGDPRLAAGAGPDGRFLVGEMVDFGGGEYVIGEDEPIKSGGDVWDAHCPSCRTTLRAFAIGRYAVTNAEWACFMAAGGYGEERWWDTAAARAWRSGVGTSEGMRESARISLSLLRRDPGRLEQWHASGGIDDALRDRWLLRLEMSSEAFEAHLAELYPDEQLVSPRFWFDGRFSNPAQPVVGISWYEARAYCNWLSAQGGRAVRLPSEAEREAAARGRCGRAYAYGASFDVWAANTGETHVRSTTPAGVFPSGDSPEGVCDLAGNTADWTSTAFGPADGSWCYRYPVDPLDGREEAEASPNTLRVARGGSWNYGRRVARASFRSDLHPALRSFGLGLRLAADG